MSPRHVPDVCTGSVSMTTKEKGGCKWTNPMLKLLVLECEPPPFPECGWWVPLVKIADLIESLKREEERVGHQQMLTLVSFSMTQDTPPLCLQHPLPPSLPSPHTISVEKCTTVSTKVKTQCGNSFFFKDVPICLLHHSQ